MANVNGPFGLRPVRKLGGGVITQNEYSIAHDYATKIFVGDVVEMSGTGRNITQAAATNVDNIGVFRGCSYVDANGSWVFAHYWPGVSDGKKNIVAYVIDDPDVIFECQATTIAEADIGNVAQILVGTGNSNTGLSALQWDGGNKAANGAGKSLRAMRLVNRPDNEYGAYAKIEVMFAEHALMGVVSAVGGV
jgi:hypothetical protein